MTDDNSKKWLFLLGTFSMTQVQLIGSIGISELVIFITAPFIFLKDYAILKHDGFGTLLFLLFSCCVGCVVGSIVNETPIVYALKGFASPYALFCGVVVGHRLLRKAPDGLKWFVLGVALSVTINIFIFQRSVESVIYAEGEKGLDAVNGIMSSPIFWTARIKAWIDVPIHGWYMQCPTFFSVFIPIAYVIFAMLTTASGRSAALGAIGSIVIVLAARKSVERMRRLQKSFFVFLCTAVIMVIVITSAYKYAATSGILGEDAQRKYEGQTKGREGVLALLMGGRLEFFVGLYANLQKPIIGYGPWALDQDGYYEDFLYKYGSSEDFDKYQITKEWQLKQGYFVRNLLPSHSHIIGFWQAYGIAGLLLWLYVLGQIVRYFRKDLISVPAWFGFIAVATPSLLWNVFFSPLGDRISVAMFMVALMFTRSVRMGRFYLPHSMMNDYKVN